MQRYSLCPCCGSNKIQTSIEANLLETERKKTKAMGEDKIRLEKTRFGTLTLSSCANVCDESESR